MIVRCGLAALPIAIHRLKYVRRSECKADG
jgi:hypothetical protein